MSGCVVAPSATVRAPPVRRARERAMARAGQRRGNAPVPASVAGTGSVDATAIGAAPATDAVGTPASPPRCCISSSSATPSTPATAMPPSRWRRRRAAGAPAAATGPARAASAAARCQACARPPACASISCRCPAWKRLSIVQSPGVGERRHAAGHASLVGRRLFGVCHPATCGPPQRWMRTAAVAATMRTVVGVPADASPARRFPPP